MRLVLVCCLWATLTAAPAMADGDLVQLATLEEPAGQAADPWTALNPKKLKLRSEAALIVDKSGNVVFAKHADEPRPIASITKLMTAIVVLDSGLPLDEPITITKDDRDLIKLTGSRLGYGSTLTREELLRLALMASENRAANALARAYPNGKKGFVDAMNRKAGTLGMHRSRFADPAGLDPGNVASARDLVTLIEAAQAYPLIREATTARSMTVRPYEDRGLLRFGNTNRLLRRAEWEIGLSKTGYINEAGRCLAMQTAIADRPLVIVLLDSFGKLTPFGDSNRIRRWIESQING
jgi:D-alanyl-D-alanine endopeptidase (penicillin-binding protein 7)